MDSRDAYIAQLEQQNKALLEQVANLSKQIENLTEIIRQMRKDKFGASSEKTPKEDLGEQMYMPQVFNEIEVEAGESEGEPCKVTREGKIRVRNKGTRKELILKNIPILEKVFALNPVSLVCSECGAELKEIGKTFVRDEIEYIPAKLQVNRYYQISYECPKCKHGSNPVIRKASVPQSVLPHSLASPSSVANVISQKYVNGMPLYRQEQEWKNSGVLLSRATMANWCIRCNEEYFTPVVEALRKELLSRDIVHCDETPVQVLKEDGKKPQTKSYMWLYRTGNDRKAPVVLFDYKPSRSGENAAVFLKDFKGYVHSDGYAGYNRLTEIVRCGCWAHLRRKFVEAIPDKKDGNTRTPAETGRDYCDTLFRIERNLENMVPEERYKKRLELERPVLDEFWNWLENLRPLAGSALARATVYATNQKPYMENYLLDGRLCISNNPAENAIRPFTVGRKNWLFSDTVRGAEASAAIYSIVETAKANVLDVYSYFKYLLEQMTNCDWRCNRTLLKNMLPWAEPVQAACERKQI